jgi:hypothetical protein
MTARIDSETETYITEGNERRILSMPHPSVLSPWKKKRATAYRSIINKLAQFADLLVIQNLI